MESKNFVKHPNDLAIEVVPSEPHQLYCICRTADESNMIGCDKCEEWYHFGCVGIDISQILDIESYEFTCPRCRAKDEDRKKK